MALEAGSVYAVLGGKFMPTGFAQFDAAMKKSAASAGAAEAQINRSSGRSAAAMGALGTAARTGAAAGLLAVGVAAVSSVKSARTFEAKMSDLKAVSGATSKQFAIMRKAALDLGASTGVGATKAAGALTDLAKGGLDAETSIQALRGTIRLAQAGDMELADASNTVVKALSMFNLQGTDASLVADGLASAANATSMDVRDFAMALGQGGVAAASAGFTFEDTINIMASLGNKFMSGSDMGTSLKNTIVSMAAPTGKAKEEMDRLGISLFDAEGKHRSVADIVNQLSTSFGKLSDQERIAAAKRIAGTDSMRTLLALMDASGKSVVKQGAAQDLAAKKMDNYEGASKRLSASFESLKIEAGTALMPALTDAANGLATFFNQLRSGEGTAGAIGKVLKTIGVGIAAIGGSRAAIANFSQLFPPSMVSGALSVLGVIRALISGFLSLASVGARLPGPLSAPYKLLGQSAKMALDDIDRVTGSLRRGLQQNQPKLKIVAEKQDAIRSIQEIQRSKIAPKVAKILGQDSDAKSKIRALIALGIPRKIATVLANTGSAQAAISQVRAELASITSKTVTLTVRRVGSAISGNASGRGAGTAETALVGEGGGPEYVVNARTGRSVRVDGPTVMSLSAEDYVIPTESRYRGRALGLIADMAADMGLVGYARGRAAKKKESAKARKKRRDREDRRIGIADTRAGMFGTQMDTEQVQGNQRAWQIAKDKRIDALKTHLGRVTAARKRTKPGSQRYTELSAKASEIRNAIARTKAESYQVDALDTGLTDGEQNQIDALDAAVALAALTEGTGDDLAALQGKAGALSGMLQAAQSSGRPSRVISELAGQLKSTRDEIGSLTGQAAAAPGTVDSGPTPDQIAQNEQAMNRARITAQEQFINRLVGATIGGGQTLVFQSYVPPSPTEAKRLADYTVGGIGYQGATPSSTERIGV